MDYLNELGSLAVGSRLKRLSERVGNEVASIYQDQGIEFEPRWFPVFRYVAEQGRAAIMDIAAAVGVSHPAVNQMAQELTQVGLIVASTDPTDKRKRLLALSAKGKRIFDQVMPVWNAIHATLSDVTEETEKNLLNVIAAYERALDRCSLLSRFEQIYPMLNQGESKIVEYNPMLSEHFSRLNRDWIEKYFALEKADLDLFANPGAIIKDGGVIFFAQVGTKIVGTCALLRKGATMQLAKMAVDEAYQGMGIGRELLRACIKRAKERKAKAITLDTNTNLKAAIGLYRKMGFTPIENSETYASEYSRVNLSMQLRLDGERGKQAVSSAKSTRRR